ncbi:MAG: DNA translocase FtsK 4TM domain-containing protein [candidate division Zixibacteria bacterium]|nr:DNA translocase FtsK 4TM domain-containing protein [candidate division Zixibacteria bacterium]
MARANSKKNENKRQKIFAVLLLLVALLCLISLISNDFVDAQRITGELDSHLSPFEISYRNQGGLVGAYLAYFLTTLLGWLAYFLPLGFVATSIRLFTSRKPSIFRINTLLLFSISISATLIYNVNLFSTPTISSRTDSAGGFVSEQLTQLCLYLVDDFSYVLLTGVILIILIGFSSFSWRFPSIKWNMTLFGKMFRILISILSFRWLVSLISKFKSNQDDKDEDEYELEQEDQEGRSQDTDNIPGETPARDERKFAPERRLTKLVRSAEQLQLKSVQYEYPPLDLLDDTIETSETTVNTEEMNLSADLLRDALESFGISIEGTISKQPGPVITRYEFKPGSGIKVSQINNLADDLALALRARQIRLIAPIPGKAAVGVEIPNRNPQMVRLKEILNSPEFADSSKKLPLVLGKTTSGKPYVTDLAKLPHLLVAGATGAGKSVCLNTIISSLIYRLHPHQIRFIMIDPKMLELTVYSGIPHLGRPVVTDPKRAERVLFDAVKEMESRYRKLAAAGVRSIDDFNKRQDSADQRMPYIVIVVDELADLMMSSGSNKIELQITRLAQMARAVGIHLILATQRPSVDVITGIIKANFPSRIAFQVSSKVDSRTIIDANGAEKLLGLGDMLFLPSGQPQPTRIHGAYTSNDETDKIVEFINSQGLEMMALEGITQATGEATEAEIDLGDPLFKEACDVVVRQKQGSVSLLQRRLGIGYQRAARLIDKLEQAGIVSAFDGSKAREVLVDKAYIETIFNRQTSSAAITSELNQQ